MNKPESPAIRFHEDPALFREAVNFTAAETAFVPRLVEKDYFCTVLLEYLAGVDDALVFKGGTCLAKVHADFYRLSEDLDFVIPTPQAAARSERSLRATGLKKAVAGLAHRRPSFRIVQPLTGANRSTQYSAVVGYASLLGDREETIKIEAGLRETLLTPAINGAAKTLLLDPVSGQTLIQPFAVRCISREEAFAEKFRAALSRREAAIRDFFDIDYAVRRTGLRHQDARFVDLVKRKLAIPGNDPVDVSGDRLAALRRQLETELKPLLRANDFAGFDLERAFLTVTAMAANLT
jgi:predicted nucleotidyltransferase component of viral defense system